MRKKFKGYKFNTIRKKFNDFYNNHLPFTLTNAQKRVLRDIRSDVKDSKSIQMSRLLQGDVEQENISCFVAMLIAVDNNFQACLNGSTEILF